MPPQRKFKSFAAKLFDKFRTKVLKREAAQAEVKVPVILECGAKPTEEAPQPIVEAVSAPEPSEVIWENLELDDAHEQRAEKIGYAVVAAQIFVGAVLIILVRWAISEETQSLDTASGDDSSGLWALMTTIYVFVVSSSVSAVTFLLDVLIRRAVVKLTANEGQDTQTEYEQSVFFKLAGAFIFNSALVPIVTGIFMSLISGGSGVDQSWYEKSGVAYQAFMLIVFNGIKEVNKAIPFMALVKRKYVSQFVYSQSKLNEIWKPPKMRMGVLYAETVKIVSLGLIYGPFFPLCFIVTSIALGVSYLCTRFGIARWYSKPPTVDQGMMMTMRTFLGQVLLLSIVINVMATHASLSKDATDSGMAVYVFIPLLWLLYVCIPLSCAARPRSDAVRSLALHPQPPPPPTHTHTRTARALAQRPGAWQPEASHFKCEHQH